MSSVRRTYRSNISLINLHLPAPTDATVREIQSHIESAVAINRGHLGSPGGAGRSKVIETQLNSQKRKELCRLQCLDYSHGSIFAEIEPILLPEVLALVGGKHGQNELYQMLLGTAPDLVSIVNRKAVIKQQIADHLDKVRELKKELASIESAEEMNQPMIGRKRGRYEL